MSLVRWTSQNCAFEHVNARISELNFNLCNRAIQVDGAAGVAQNHRLKAKPPRIERGIADAEIVGQSNKKAAPEPALAQIAGQAGVRGAVVLKKRGVGIDLRAKSFAQNQLGLRQIECSVERGSGSALHAVRGPQSLRAVVQLNRIVRLFAGMRRRERSVICRMPVLRK